MIATGSQELGLNIIDVKSKNVDFSTTHTLMSWLEWIFNARYRISKLRNPCNQSKRA